MAADTSASKFCTEWGCAKEKKIKKCYRTNAAVHHPDKGGDAETFKRLQGDYDSLRDDVKEKNCGDFASADAKESRERKRRPTSRSEPDEDTVRAAEEKARKEAVERSAREAAEARRARKTKRARKPDMAREAEEKARKEAVERSAREAAEAKRARDVMKKKRAKEAEDKARREAVKRSAKEAAKARARKMKTSPVASAAGGTEEPEEAPEDKKMLQMISAIILGHKIPPYSFKQLRDLINSDEDYPERVRRGLVELVDTLRQLPQSTTLLYDNYFVILRNLIKLQANFEKEYTKTGKLHTLLTSGLYNDEPSIQFLNSVIEESGVDDPKKFNEFVVRLYYLIAVRENNEEYLIKLNSKVGGKRHKKTLKRNKRGGRRKGKTTRNKVRRKGKKTRRKN